MFAGKGDAPTADVLLISWALIDLFIFIIFLKATEQIWMPQGNEGEPANASNMEEKGSQHETSSSALPVCRGKFGHVL